MLEMILQAIKANQVENYLINLETVETAELFFIKRELDMRRMKKVSSYTVTVYHDFEKDGQKMRGSSSALVLPEMSAQDIEKAIADACYAASFVCNPYFELPKGTKEEPHTASEGLAAMTLEEAAEAFARALYAAEMGSSDNETPFINTAEIFAERKEVSICNSQGIDVSYTTCRVKGEFVVQCIAPQDVELYQDFDFTAPDTEALTAQAKEALETVCARAHATKAPKSGEYTVLLSGREMRTFFDLYRNRACTAYIYPGYSNYKTGMQVQGEDVTGECINMTLIADEPYSIEGIRMEDMELVKNGTLQGIYGNSRFCYYLGVKPTGNYKAMRIDNGTKTMNELKSEPYLHVVSFSDFQMDTFSGHFGGEIRLAYLYDGEKVTLVTGGTINGSLLELQGDMAFSTERYKDSYYDGPMAVRLHHVQVAGV